MNALIRLAPIRRVTLLHHAFTFRPQRIFARDRARRAALQLDAVDRALALLRMTKRQQHLPRRCVLQHAIDVAVGAVFGAAAAMWAENSDVSPLVRFVAVALIRSPVVTAAVNAGEVKLTLPEASVTTVMAPRSRYRSPSP